MQTYIAHYSSPAASDARAKGLFEFEANRVPDPRPTCTTPE